MSKYYIPTLGPQSWQALLADPVKHWRTGYSARTIAHCWEAAQGLPPEIAALFGLDAELLIAIPEHKVSLRDAGRESQTDVFALVKSNGRTIAVAVEGKVTESFGPVVRDWYADPSPGKQQRLAFLCDLIGAKCPPPGDVHYQLFHRTASAVIEAERFKTDDAAMIVHSFSQETDGLKRTRPFSVYSVLKPSRDNSLARRSRAGELCFLDGPKATPDF